MTSSRYGTLLYLSCLWDLGKLEQKGVGEALKSSIEVAKQATKGGLFYRERGFSPCNTAVL